MERGVAAMCATLAILTEPRTQANNYPTANIDPSSGRPFVAHGLEPENVDKEFLRLWFADHCDPYGDEVLPDAPEELVEELSRRYVALYETITGQAFAPASPEQLTEEAIEKAIAKSIVVE